MFNRIAQFFTSPNTSLFFIGLLFCVPFCVGYHHRPIPAFVGEWLAAALGVVAMLAILSKNFWQNIKLPQISLVFLGLATIVCMQWMLGMLHSPQFSLLILSYIAWAFLLTILGSYLRQTLGWEELATTLAWVMVLGAIYNIGFVALQIAMKSGIKISLMPNLGRYGALGQPNNFADYIGMGVASLMYLYAKRKMRSQIFWPGLVLFLTLLAFSGSRSSWIYLMGLTAFAIILQIKAIKQQTSSPNIRSLLRVGLILLPLFSLLQLAIHYGLPDNLIDLPTERLNDAIDNKSASLRWQFWQTSWYLFTQNPWLGIGIGQMRWQSFMLIDSAALNPSKMVFEHSHNIFMHLLTEMGIGAALFAIIGLGTWAWFFKWRELNLERWWLIALLGIMGIHSILEYPLWYTYFLGVFAFLLGAGEEKISQFNCPKIGKLVGAGAFGLILLVSVVNLGTLFMANIKLEHWTDSAANKNVKTISKTKFINDFAWIHNNSLLAPYAEIMFVNAATVNNEQLDDLVLMSESVMRFMPTQSITYQYALLLKLKGDEAAAAKQLNRALIAYPKGLKSSIEFQPTKYWQDYLDILSVARSIKK